MLQVSREESTSVVYMILIKARPRRQECICSSICMAHSHGPHSLGHFLVRSHEPMNVMSATVQNSFLLLQFIPTKVSDA